MVTALVSLSGMLLVCLSWSTASVGQKKTPVKADFSDPRKTCETFYRALQADDLELLLRCSLEFPDKESDRLRYEFARYWLASFTLERLVKEKFGHSFGRSRKRGPEKKIKEWLTGMKALPLQEVGSRATITLIVGTCKFTQHFQKQNGEWKMVYFLFDKEHWDWTLKDQGDFGRAYVLVQQLARETQWINQQLREGNIKSLAELRVMLGDRYGGDELPMYGRICSRHLGVIDPIKLYQYTEKMALERLRKAEHSHNHQEYLWRLWSNK